MVNDELMPYATGEVTPRRGDRRVARRAKDVYDEVRVKAHMERGAFALGADIMDQTVLLYNKGAQLAGDDPVLGRILSRRAARHCPQGAGDPEELVRRAGLVSLKLIVGISCLTFSSLIAGFAIWLDHEPVRRTTQTVQDVSVRILEAQRQIRQLFRESHRRMDRAAGKRDDFHLGPWEKW